MRSESSSSIRSVDLPNRTRRDSASHSRISRLESCRQRKKSDAVVRIRILPSVALLVIVSSAVMAQVFDSEGRCLVYKGRDVPMYNLVSAFFDQTLWRSKDLRNFEQTVLGPLGISPGSPAERALIEACTLAETVMASGEDLTPYIDDPEEFKRRQELSLRIDVETTEQIFDGLLTLFESEGVNLNNLSRYLDSEVRPTLSVSACGSDAAEAMEKFQNFKSRLPRPH